MTELQSTILCPMCGYAATETMPTNGFHPPASKSCQRFQDCPSPVEEWAPRWNMAASPSGRRRCGPHALGSRQQAADTLRFDAHCESHTQRLLDLSTALQKEVRSVGC